MLRMLWHTGVQVNESSPLLRRDVEPNNTVVNVTRDNKLRSNRLVAHAQP